ncbi:MAG: phosphoribosyl-ATP diphosphatase [Chloroflexi bacterium]|nr:phosphoribosyl-ATP diphosphatase [Chloroflexota bacterium]MBP8055216.1 phosphoribosyl-ATP diphosphatase [Chloroflexota bacterium]
MNDFLTELTTVLQARKQNPTPGSYTSQLLAKGVDEIIKKIGEEAIEIIVAAKGQGQERLISEVADLIFNVSVLLVAVDLTWDDVAEELARRRKPANSDQ